MLGVFLVTNLMPNVYERRINLHLQINFFLLRLSSYLFAY